MKRVTLALLFLFIAPLLFFLIPTSPAQALPPRAPSEPLVQSTTKIIRTINTIPGFFNGVPTGSNITVTYGYHPLGAFWFSNSQGNFTTGLLTLKCGSLSFALPMSTGGKVYSNSTFIAYNLTPISGCAGSIWLYFKTQKGALNYPSPNMKVIITGTLSTSGTLNLVFLGGSLTEVTDLSGKTKYQVKMLTNSLGFDWSDSASLNPTYNPATKTLSYSVGTSFTIDPTTIATSTASRPTGYNHQRKTCFMNTRYVAAQSDGTNLIQYSATNAAFTTSVVSNSIRAVTAGEYFGSWCDTTNNKWGYVFANGGANLFVRTYGFASDGSLTADFAEVDIAGQLPATENNLIKNPSIYFSGTTDDWVVTGSQIAAGNVHVNVMYCAATCGTATNWSSKNDYNTGQGSNDWSGIITALSAAAKKSLIMGSTTATAAQIKTTADTGATWSTLRATTSNFLINSCSAASISDTTHVACTFSNNPRYFNFGLAPTGAPTETDEDTSSSNTAGIGISSDNSATLVIAFCSGTTVFTQTSTNSGSTFASKVTQTSSETSITYCGSSYAVDSSSEIQTVWGAGSASPFNFRFMNVALTVTINTKCNTSPAGATQDTVTFSGAGVTPTSEVCNGVSNALTANPSASLTVTVGTAAANKEYHFNTAGTLLTQIVITTPASGSATWVFTDYLLDLVTVSYSVSGGGSPTAPTLSFISGGNATTYAMTTTGVQQKADDGTSWSATNPLSGAGANQRFQANSGVLGPASAGLTINPTYYNQYTNNFAYSLTGGGTFNAPTLSGNSFGSTTTVTLPTVAAGTYFDASSTTSVTNPMTGSSASSTERGQTNTAAPTINSGGGTTTFAYYHQFSNTYAAAVHNQPSWDYTYSIAVTGTYFANSATVCTITATAGTASDSCSGWGDVNTVASLPSSFADQVSGTWTAFDTYSFTDASTAGSHTTNYDLSGSSNPNPTPSGSSGTPGGGGGGPVLIMPPAVNIETTQPEVVAANQSTTNLGILLIIAIVSSGVLLGALRENKSDFRPPKVSGGNPFRSVGGGGGDPFAPPRTRKANWRRPRR